MPNRLSGETSPYLLQHAENPVDWYPWNEEAFEVAKKLGRPVFLSVGYSSCHWCHVMAHECFEDESVAALLNEKFVSVKVDREERPDVDDAYMLATQLMTGRGGWPMTVFMTPDKQPFFAGTYFPKEDRDGRPGFTTLCSEIAQAWSSRRSEVEESAREVAGVLAQSTTATPPAGGAFSKQTFEGALHSLMQDFDQESAGFGSAPKFPPHTAIEFLTTFAMMPTFADDLRDAAIAMAMSTLAKMAMGGIYDHVGGGFHRYSTDGDWLVPHFEKMLYDNALMMGNLARTASLVHESEPDVAEMLQKACDRTAHWLLTEMTGPEGVFCSALDADSQGEEGKFYVWGLDELREILGTHAEDFAAAYGATSEGNFLDEASGIGTGANILHLDAIPTKDFGIELEMLGRARASRIPPGLDDKALVGWNGLAIEGLVLAGYLSAAANAAVAILGAERAHGRLPRQIAKGAPSGDAYLEDYAYFVNGLFQLAGVMEYLERSGRQVEGVPGSAFWIGEAGRLGREMVDQFYDSSGFGFFATSDRHEVLFGRSKPVLDHPWPSANAVAIGCMFMMGDAERAAESLHAFAGWTERAPQATMAMLTKALASGLVSMDVPAATGPATPTRQEVDVRLVEKEIRADADGTGVGRIRFTVPEGVHLNTSDPAARWLTPTRIAVRPLKAEVTYPDPVDEGYDGEFDVSFALRLPNGESGAEFEVEVEYQACTDSECLSPAKRTFNGVLYR